MINVQNLYDDVSQVLKKNFAGFLNGPDFSNAIKSAELKAFEHFVSYFERSSRIVDALFFFISGKVITANSAGVVTVPADYRHHIRLSRYFVTNNPADGGEPIVKYKKMNYCPSNAVEDMMADFLKKPDIKKGRFIYTVENGALKIYDPAPIATYLRYIRSPVFGKIAFTPQQTVNGDEYVFDAANSQDLEWPDHVYTLIKYLILEEYGQEVRDKIMAEYGLQEATMLKQAALIN